MKLLTKDLLKKLPSIESTANLKLSEVIVYVKLFTPWSNWTWYIAAYDPETGECFGLVIGFEKEWGYFNLHELEEIRGIGGLKVERDRWFSPIKFADLKNP